MSHIITYYMQRNYRVATPPLSSVELATPLTNITNHTALPKNISEALQLLQRDYDIGDLTQQGLVKRQNFILSSYLNMSFEKQGHVSQRKLLSLAETELADWISNSKMKQISLASDMDRYSLHHLLYYNLIGYRAIQQWEWQHGPWVS